MPRPQWNIATIMSGLDQEAVIVIFTLFHCNERTKTLGLY